LLVIIGTLAHIGGAERQALYLVQHLVTLGRCDVELLSFEDGDAVRPQLAALGVRVHILPYYFRWPKAKRARALAQLAALLRLKIKPAALLPFVGIHSKTAAMVWPFSGARFCWWNQQDEGRDLTGTAIEKRILRRVSCITSNSEAGRDFLVATYGLEADSVLVYNNGTPVPSRAPALSMLSQLGLDDRMVVTMVANVTPFKDHPTLLRAWAQVKEHFGPPRAPILLLAGHLRDADTVTALKTLAFELGLSSDDVRFLGAVSDVEGIIRGSDLVVHSSLTEGCPNAVCEAMALGKAVIATNIPGCTQALGSEEWLAKPSDPVGLAELIVRALEDDDLRATLGRANKARIESDFTIDGMNRFFVQQIESRLGRVLS
jgi:glycosyltransferase involved in cell wall biosynthesis